MFIMNKLILSSLMAFALLVPGSVLASSGVDVFVSGKSLSIKQVEDEKVKSDFEIKPESVVQVTEGTNLVVTTVPPNNVEKVKVTGSAGVMTELQSLGNNEYSLFSFLPGAYLLDVIVNLPDSDKRAAYETVLIILKQGQQPIQTQEIVTKVKVVTKVDIDFDDNDKGKDRHHKKCSDKEGSAGLAYPYGKRTECELEKKQDCEKDRLAGKQWNDDCKDNNHAFDDDCEGFANQRECDEYWSTPEPLPPCGEGVNEEGLCRDEIDDCTDESGCTPVEEDSAEDENLVGEVTEGTPEDDGELEVEDKGETDEEFEAEESTEEPEEESSEESSDETESTN